MVFTVSTSVLKELPFTVRIALNVLMKGFFTLINNFFNYQINGTSAGW